MKTMKTAILVLSDPESGSKEEAFGRLFNALGAAWDFKQSGDEVTVLFQGAGTRWIGQVTDPEHPAHDLYAAVADTVAGVSCACADAFGGSEDAERNGLDLIGENAVPGTSGLPSLRRLVSEGYSVIAF